MIKTYNICVIMNLNQKYILKLLFYSQQPTYLLNLDVSFTLCQACSQVDMQGQCP